ncbi:hypothetical protein AFE_2846 [Acidithiobacillus ferrooxidans ATCC 23270]|uniref:Uncharacterized protein n=1 Tax=Acidithiobacillus ferrooxidans (strain ATCC 23270 / DSM 14882 / CIP 104768 / NCIMB 8455) TaxID=243159 RepID=B7J940_ACIF2|nr:hypothetical protein AFE_2846 [Acidithiobacillus ferrooxidans ATCC 23270]
MKKRIDRTAFLYRFRYGQNRALSRRGWLPGRLLLFRFSQGVQHGLEQATPEGAHAALQFAAIVVAPGKRAKGRAHACHVAAGPLHLGGHTAQPRQGFRLTAAGGEDDARKARGGKRGVGLITGLGQGFGILQAHENGFDDGAVFFVQPLEQVGLPLPGQYMADDANQISPAVGCRHAQAFFQWRPEMDILAGGDDLQDECRVGAADLLSAFGEDGHMVNSSQCLPVILRHRLRLCKKAQRWRCRTR